MFRFAKLAHYEGLTDFNYKQINLSDDYLQLKIQNSLESGKLKSDCCW